MIARLFYPPKRAIITENLLQSMAISGCLP
jgi:hypothetical protein